MVRAGAGVSHMGYRTAIAIASTGGVVALRLGLPFGEGGEGFDVLEVTVGATTLGRWWRNRNTALRIYWSLS